MVFKPETITRMIEDIYRVVDRQKVFEQLNPVDRGSYFELRCPACGKRRAFIYKSGHEIKCNRINNCGYRANLIQFVAGTNDQPRGDMFKAAVLHLARLSGISLAEDRHAYETVSKPVAVIPPMAYPEAAQAGIPIILVRELRAQFEKSKVAKEYIEKRGIPLGLARRFGVGYAPYGHWPHRNKKGKPVRQGRPARVVFPIKTQNRIINLYGRVATDDCPKKIRHDFLPGSKGIFNSKALTGKSVFIVEGVMDALSLIAAGKPNVSAVFGTYGLRWDSIRARNICIGFDPDQIGREAWEKVMDDGVSHGKKMFYLKKEMFQGYKDLNELWQHRREINIMAERYPN